MRKTVKLTLALLAGAMLAPLATTPAAAQALSGRNLPDKPRIGVSFYKTPPGKQDEWLELYLKWHRPIMEYQIEKGVTISSTVYANSGHSIEPDWDFMIVSFSPPAGSVKPLDKTRGEVIKLLYPDIDAYVAGEKKRWEYTVKHWDLDVTELDLTAEHPGVYYPILPKKK